MKRLQNRREIRKKLKGCKTVPLSALCFSPLDAPCLIRAFTAAAIGATTLVWINAISWYRWFKHCEREVARQQPKETEWHKNNLPAHPQTAALGQTATNYNPNKDD